MRQLIFLWERKMNPTHYWKRLSGAGAAALLITGSLALVMQALVLRGDMELGVIDVTCPSISGWRTKGLKSLKQPANYRRKWKFFQYPK
jgi:hypothetical protein